MRAIVFPAKLSGSQLAPASKSSMQRACAAALLHKGKTQIFNPGYSNDDLAALNIIQILGAVVSQQKDYLEVISSGVKPIASSMNCGESGLGIRMFTPIAALSDQTILIQGQGSLVQRPMHFFDEIFPSIGVQIQSNNGFLPITIHGPLQPKDIIVDGSLSSQFLTGLLMAFAAAGATRSTIYVKDLNSKPYIDLTLAILKHFGWDINHQNYEYFTFKPRNSILDAIQYTVEGDWSGAAFLLVAGAIAGPISVKGLQLDSTQADKAVMNALLLANAAIEIEADIIKIGPRLEGLNAFEFDATDCPDLFPPLVALAALCKGVTTIKGVNRLAYKESNRGISLQTEFAKLGVNIQLEGDYMNIEGVDQVQANAVFSHHDHRIVMACGVAALRATGPIEITEAEAVNKSYTDFFEHLKHLGVRIDIQ